KSILVLNGGAAVALIAFAGSLSGHSSAINFTSLARAVVLFGSGAFIATLAHVTGYLSQVYYGNFMNDPIGNARSHARHVTLNHSTLALVCAALLVFAGGLYFAAAA